MIHYDKRGGLLYTIKMAVRQFVSMLYQSGDLASSFLSTERANIGSRIHRKLQKAAGDSYQSEVYLSDTCELDDICFILEGRADGITVQGTDVMIDEIKTTTAPYDDIQDKTIHWAQCYCYCYMYMKQEHLERVIAQLTYVQVDTSQIKTFQKSCTFSQMEEFYMGMLQNYLDFARQLRDYEEIKLASIHALSFPFEHYRKGQRELAVSVYRAIQEKRDLFAMAPTGIGKTISTLFPSIKSIAQLQSEKIFYLCAKNITASVALDTMKLLYEHHLRVKCVHITAKEKMCAMQEKNCDPDVCPYAKGYYDKLQPVLRDLLEHYDLMDKNLFAAYGRQYMLCPFELSLDMAVFADVIICDYNYIFDPQVYLKRFMNEGGNFVFLVDEAHNLVDRARSMYSKELYKSSFMELKKLLPDHRDMVKACTKVNAAFLDLKKLMNEECFYTQKELHTGFLQTLQIFVNACDQFLQREKDKELSEKAKDVYFEVLAFLRICEYYDEHYITILEKEKKELRIKLFCLDPHIPLQQMKARAKSTTFFSATLTPSPYFLQLLGGEEDAMRIRFPSPFEADQSLIIVNDAISTKYRNRQESLKAVCDMIMTTICAKQGNYIVFFPSYQYMNMCYDMFHELYENIPVRVQNNTMQESEKKEFLTAFDKTDQLNVSFCVLGGMFSEGIDLKGEKLIGSIIVGVGLPQINDEQNLIKDHFSEKGYHYAYTYPGMNKVLQAAGRVIRSKQDKGVIVLLDERFTTNTYRSLIPPHFSHYQIVRDLETMQKKLRIFWDTEQ